MRCRRRPRPTFSPAQFAVVVVGDRKAIEAGVRGLKLGPVRVLTVDGGTRVMSLTIGFERAARLLRPRARQVARLDRRRSGAAGDRLQTGGRFPTAAACSTTCSSSSAGICAGSRAATPPEEPACLRATGEQLFEYADLVRADLPALRVGPDGRGRGRDDDHVERRRVRTVHDVAPQALTHIVLHEIRHLAQLALAARTAGMSRRATTTFYFQNVGLKGPTSYAPTPYIQTASNTPVSRFFRTLSHAKCCPFIAMYTPGGSTCANESALPRLNNPSELPNAYGIIAPVRTTVLPGTPAASAAAVSTIVSVPCVMTMRDSGALDAVADNQLAIGIGHVEAVHHHQRSDGHIDARPAEAQHLGQVRVAERQRPRISS